MDNNLLHLLWRKFTIILVKLFNDNTYVMCRLKFATDIKWVDGTTGNNQIKGQQVKLNSFTIFNTVDADILNNGNILENEWSLW